MLHPEKRDGIPKNGIPFFFCVVVILRCKKRFVVLKRFKVGASSLFVLYIKYYGRGHCPFSLVHKIFKNGAMPLCALNKTFPLFYFRLKMGDVHFLGKEYS